MKDHLTFIEGWGPDLPLVPSRSDMIRSSCVLLTCPWCSWFLLSRTCKAADITEWQMVRG